MKIQMRFKKAFLERFRPLCVRQARARRQADYQVTSGLAKKEAKVNKKNCQRKVDVGN